ncbi:hypothetical protein ACFL4G_11550 [Thermodesulfobacteriota bacterium]
MLEPTEIKARLQEIVNERLSSQIETFHKLETEGEKLAKSMFEGVKGMLPEEQVQKLSVIPMQAIQKYLVFKEKVDSGITAVRTRLDIPSSNELEKLSAKIDGLSAEVAKLKKKPAAKKGTTARKRTTKK